MKTILVVITLIAGFEEPSKVTTPSEGACEFARDEVLKWIGLPIDPSSPRIVNAFCETPEEAADIPELPPVDTEV